MKSVKTISVDENFWVRVVEQAWKYRKSISEYVVDALEKQLKKDEKKCHQ